MIGWLNICVLVLLAGPPQTRQQATRPYPSQQHLQELEAAPMARTVWNNGAGTRLLNTAGNYTNGLPTTDVMFDGNALTPLTSLADRGNFALNQCTFLRSHVGGIGSASFPLQVRPDSEGFPSGTDLAANLSVMGSGLYHVIMDSADATGRDVVCDIPHDPSSELFLMGRIRLLGLRNGKCTIVERFDTYGAQQTSFGGTAHGGIYVFGNSHLVVPSGVEMSGLGTFTDVYVGGGLVDFASDIPATVTVLVTGGVLNLTGDIANLTHVYCTGGRIKWRPAAASSNTPIFKAIGDGVIDIEGGANLVGFGGWVIGPNGTILNPPSIEGDPATGAMALNLSQLYP